MGLQGYLGIQQVEKKAGHPEHLELDFKRFKDVKEQLPVLGAEKASWPVTRESWSERRKVRCLDMCMVINT